MKRSPIAVRIIRRTLLAALAAILLLQWAYPDYYFSLYNQVQIVLTRAERRRGAAILRREYRENALVGVGYEYGLAVQRFYKEPQHLDDVCMQLRFADGDLGLLGDSPEYFNEKLRGLGDVRGACAAAFFSPVVPSDPP